MSRFAPLHVETLETRDVPVTFGTPWPDGQHITLSFAPDGTPIGGSPSDFAALLATLSPDAQLEVLRAFQAWAVQANVNIGLVSDSGAAFGSGGAVQGDPRFGDVRVGGRTLSPDVLAITAPYNLYDNYSGDVVVNTAARFGAGGYDLYTALLQESGHALGVGNSPDRKSVMYEDYLGTRTGLSAADVASIRALYGARQADKYEGANGNGTPGTATSYPVIGGPLTADLTTATDVDVYKFTAGFLTNSVTVNLRAAGLSLVTARVELLDSGGRVLAAAVANDPTKNDLTLSLGSVRAGQTYFVRVSAARPDFAVGSYELEVKQSSLLSQLTDIVGNLLDETGLNDTLLTATTLLSKTLTVGAQTEFSAQASFGSARDVDYYRVTVPPSATGGSVNMLVTVWGQNGRALNPWLEVTDSLGRKLTADVIAADGNTTTIQIRGLAAGQTVFIKAFSDTKAVGDYTLAADLRTVNAMVPDIATGTVSAAAPLAVAAFSLAQTGQVHLVLTATGAAGAAEAVVTDAAGQVVGRFSANAGRGRSLDIFLSAGTYTVSVRSVSGSLLGFRLGLVIVTDPVGAQPEDPTTAPAPTAPPPTTPTSTPTDPPPPSGTSTAPPPTQSPPAEPPPTQPPPTEPTPAPQPTSASQQTEASAYWY